MPTYIISIILKVYPKQNDMMVYKTGIKSLVYHVHEMNSNLEILKKNLNELSSNCVIDYKGHAKNFLAEHSYNSVNWKILLTQRLHQDCLQIPFINSSFIRFTNSFYKVKCLLSNLSNFD